MKTLDIVDSQKLIEKYGIRFAKSSLVKNVHEALIVANSIKYPVVLKVVAENISHKTDAGAIAVRIYNDSELEDSFRKILNNVKKKSRSARIRGVLVQKMVEDGVELLIGGKKDSQFGQVIAFGLGGVFVEVMKDVSFRLAPIGKKEALEMMAETKGFKILDGYRGRSYDIDAVATLLSKVSKMLDKNKKIVELDLNPVFALKKGVMPVDARIILGD